MPIDPDDVYQRGSPGSQRRSTEQELSFASLVYELAESVAEAQLKLDFNTAETLSMLADTRVETIPEITRRIAADGSVTLEPGEPVERSLLELGFTPERYQFSEATVEVEFDVKFRTDEENETTLSADTYDAHHHRKHHGEVDTSGKISATLTPVPVPSSVTPDEIVVDERDAAADESD